MFLSNWNSATLTVFNRYLYLSQHRKPTFPQALQNWKTGRLLGGATNATIDLRYDGIIPSDPGAASLSTLLTHKMAIEVVDLRGNIRRNRSFTAA